MLSNEALAKMFATLDNTLSPDEVSSPQCPHYLLNVFNIATDVVAVLHQTVDTQLQFGPSAVWQCTEE